MIPGGFIESRDFSHISPIILSGFNTFLTVLGLSSLFIAYFNFRNHSWARYVSTLCGLSYLTVYAIDLLKIFPKTSSPFPLPLLILEIIGILLTLPLIYYSSIDKATTDIPQRIQKRRMYYILAGAIIIGIGIIIFATQAAMTAK